MPATNYIDENSHIKSIPVWGNTDQKEVVLSIVIPTYRRSDLLKKNLLAIIEQTPFMQQIRCEVIIISNDPRFNYKKLNLFLDPDIFKVYINEENLGMCGNMNRCAKMANGKYIAYIQDDDILLPNYLSEFIKLYNSHILENIDCLIPNRYYLMPNTNKESPFGKKSIRNMKIKRGIGKILRLGRKNPALQKLTPYETMVTTYPFYCGGPTCGMLFNRNTLIQTGGFNTNYPYGFDYVFFMEFSEKKNVMLYDKYLALYMTSDSASNRPEVQFDFFKARYWYMLNNYVRFGVSEEIKDIIIYATYIGYSSKVREMIDNQFSIKPVSKFICGIYMLWAGLKTYQSGGYRRKECPMDVFQWYQNLSN